MARSNDDQRGDFDPVLASARDDAGTLLTTNQGTVIANNQDSLKGGLRGPALLEDFILREKITHFDHERIPERVVHARGAAAHGYFQPYRAVPELTRASLFQDPAKRTPVFVRFSTVAGSRGSPDLARDVRGFAVKFYTDEGVWDLVGNNVPIFFIQDAIKFPDLVHAFKPEPDWEIPQAATAHDSFWDFASLSPESTAMLVWIMSDRTIPRSYRMMQGFGVHTFRMVNARGDSRFVKFHWSPLCGTHSVAWDEAVKVNGADPDFHRRDLWEAIAAGEGPVYELGVQVFTEEQAERWSFDVLDATKLVPEELVPVTPLGRLVLDRNPLDFFAETEQVAFHPGNLVPGIDVTDDPLLQGRLFSYIDTQITRLGGPNFHQLPINQARCPVHNHQRDGMHQTQVPRRRVNYEPNSLGGNHPAQSLDRGYQSFPEPVNGPKLRAKPSRFADHFRQARLFWKSQSSVEQDHIVRAFTFELGRCQVSAVRERVVANLGAVDGDLARRVSAGLGIDPPAPPAVPAFDTPAEVEASAALSLLARPGQLGVRTRQVAILAADGVDVDTLRSFRDALAAQGVVVRVVGQRMGALRGGDGAGTLETDATLETAKAVLFDGTFVADGVGSADLLAADGRAMEFIRDTHRHCKTLGAMGHGARALAAAGVVFAPAEPGVLTADPSLAKDLVDTFVQCLARHRHWDREVFPPRL